MNVISNLKNSNLCCGCGVCSNICPKKNIKIESDTLGEYKPFDLGDCNQMCNLCTTICPIDETLSIDKIGKDLYGDNDNILFEKSVGFYLNSYVGNLNNKERIKSASGGLATATLCSLIEHSYVDFVITVGKSNKEDRLFEFKKCGTVEEVKACASSAYYPVEISRVLEKILEEDNDSTYAIMALPCLVFALRKAQLKNKNLRKKIKFIFSLVCGQLVNKYFTEFMSVSSGVSRKKMESFEYRSKIKGVEASKFNQGPILNNKLVNPQEFTGFPATLWSEKFFTLECCNYCDDVFGELADAVFMDAWLENYEKDWRGTSLVVVRNNIINELYGKKNIGNCEIKSIDINMVIESQKGRIVNKHKKISGRIKVYNLKNGIKLKRRIIESDSISILDRIEIENLNKIQKKSKEEWHRYREKSDSKKFLNKMRYLRIEKKFIKGLRKLERVRV